MQVIELQCFAPIVVWAGLAEKTYLNFDIYERYEKMSFRNTYTLVGANGALRLSIPLVNGRNQRIPYKTVSIDNSQRWQQLHFRTIVSAYNRSPWFEFYQLDLKQLYEQQFETLAEWNLEAQKWLLKQLKWKGETHFSIDQPVPFISSDIIKPTGDNLHELQKCHDLRNVFAPRNIQQLLPEHIQYNQVFQDRIGFVPYCSILDLLFCEGPNSKNLLKNQVKLNAKYWNNLGVQGFLKKD